MSQPVTIQADLFDSTPCSPQPSILKPARHKPASNMRFINPSGLSNHPLAELFPSCSAAELTSLREDVQQHGILEPVVLLNGEVLDGRARVRVASDLKMVKMPFIDFHTMAQDKISAIRYLISKNITRRHLTTSQRALCAAEVIGALDNQSANLHSPHLADREQLMVAFNISRRTLFYALKVANHPDEQVKAAVQSGALTVSAAARLIVHTRGQLGEPQTSNITSPFQPLSKTDIKFIEQIETLQKSTISTRILDLLQSDCAEATVLRAHLVKIAENLLEIATRPTSR